MVYGTVLANFAMLGGFISWLFFVHRAWETVQGIGAGVKPSQAVWRFFVPFYNIYWLFRAYVGLGETLNDYVAQKTPNSRRVSLWFLYAFLIFWFLGATSGCLAETLQENCIFEYLTLIKSLHITRQIFMLFSGFVSLCALCSLMFTASAVMKERLESVTWEKECEKQEKERAEISLPRRSVAGSVVFGLIFVLMATVMARYLALQNEKLELDNLVMAQVIEYLEADVNMNLEMMKEQFRTGNLDNEYLQMKILCEALEEAKELKETGKEEMNDIERVEYALQKKTSQLDFGIRVKPGVTFDSLRFDAMSPNNLGAKLLVGIMCSRGSIFGLKDVEIEGPEKALEYLEQPGVRECVAAQHYIGWCYEELQEPEMMLKWYRKPAEEEYDHAQWILGKAYFYGECVPQDSVMAVEWLRKSAPYVPDAEIYLNAIEAVDEAEVKAVEAKKETEKRKQEWEKGRKKKEKTGCASWIKQYQVE